MHTFKGQDRKVIKDLCKDNFCHIVISHSLTNKFQSNKPAKSVIPNKYHAWFADEVTKQLATGIKLADVKVSLALSELKPPHVQWIFIVYKYHCKQPETIKNGFAAAGITETVTFSLQ